MHRKLTSLALALLLPLGLAACDDDPSGPAPLTPVQVAGAYTACTLVFVPEGNQPQVDLLQQAFDPGQASPVLALDPDRDAQFQFTRTGQFSREFINGTFTTGIDQVTVQLPTSQTVTPASVLFPDRLVLSFEAAPRQTLLTSASAQYTVPRATYARLAGISEAGLANQIPGRLTARFVQGGCA